MSIWSKIVKFFVGSPVQECKCKGQCDAMEAEARAVVEQKKVDAIIAESERIRRERERRIASSPTPASAPSRSYSASSSDDDDTLRRSNYTPSFDTFSYSSFDSSSSCCDSSSSCCDSGSSCGCD